MSPQRNRYPGVYHRPDDTRAPWWISYTADGKRIREPGGPTQKAAWEKRRDQLQAIAERRFVPPDKEWLTVGDAIRTLLQQIKDREAEIKAPAFYRAHGKAVIARIGEMRLVDVTPAAINHYIGLRRLKSGKRPKPATINKDLQVLRQAMYLAVENEQLAKVPTFHLLPENNARQGFFTAEEVAAMVAALPAPYDDVVRWAFWTGWRRGDIRALTWAMVHDEIGEIRLPETKEGRPRVLAIAGEVATILERAAARRPYTRRRGKEHYLAAHVFHWRGRPVGDFRKDWLKACEKLGLVGRRFHDLRRSALRELRIAGVADAVAMSFSGHRTMSTYLRYQITSAEDQRAAIAKRAATPGATPPEHSGRTASQSSHKPTDSGGRRDS